MATAFGRGERPAIVPRASTTSEFRLIEQLVVHDMLPRLVIAHSALPERQSTALPPIGPDQVERMAELSVQLEAHLLLELVESFLDRGLSAETLFVELLAPAARQLGKGWEEDRLDFVDVTMGLWRLQEVLRDVASRTTRQDSAGARGSALFLPFPGDQHSFGTAMVHECFTLAGWDADMLVDATARQLLDLVARKSFDLVGLTVSCDSNIEPLSALVRAVRSVSMNPHLRIMIGGRACNAHGGITAYAGADGTAANAPAAVALAERLVRVQRAEAG
jgi:MerR family transcriptional regulator, light-induced transcriptional regulator